MLSDNIEKGALDAERGQMHSAQPLLHFEALWALLCSAVFYPD